MLPLMFSCFFKFLRISEKDFTVASEDLPKRIGEIVYDLTSTGNYDALDNWLCAINHRRRIQNPQFTKS
jgi:hypothetical protein